MRTYTEKKSREQNDLKNHFVTAPYNNNGAVAFSAERLKAVKAFKLRTELTSRCTQSTPSGSYVRSAYKSSTSGSPMSFLTR